MRRWKTKVPKSKYGAKAVVVDGFRFDSKMEASYYQQLKLRQAAGKVLMFLRQVPFHLPGGTRYVCDFQEFHANGTVHFVDVKGMETSEFKLKKKMVEDAYGVEIEIVNSVS